MDTKYCTRCEKEKVITEFRGNIKTKDGLQKYCIECDKQYQKEWYLKNNIRIKVKSEKRNKNQRNIIRDFLLSYLSNKTCVICGEDNIMTLQFDHLRNKKLDIAKMKTHGIIAVKEEIEKCQILCANCHSIKTSTDRKDYKWVYSQAGKA